MLATRDRQCLCSCVKQNTQREAQCSCQCLYAASILPTPPPPPCLPAPTNSPKVLPWLRRRPLQRLQRQRQLLRYQMLDWRGPKLTTGRIEEPWQQPKISGHLSPALARTRRRQQRLQPRPRPAARRVWRHPAGVDGIAWGLGINGREKMDFSRAPHQAAIGDTSLVSIDSAVDGAVLERTLSAVRMHG